MQLFVKEGGLSAPELQLVVGMHPVIWWNTASRVAPIAKDTSERVAYYGEHQIHMNAASHCVPLS